MDQGHVLSLARQAMEVALMVSLPVLAVSLFVGILVSVFQAATQIQEMTLTFVPKILGIGVVVALLGSWMLNQLVAFTHLCFEHVARVQQG
ncbi:MAG TPA: flagellar biosynthesis protein FliQ [Fimbriimonadaceae bacterium]|nr:flagellar biosynthesis protein FliQ [Fimbriimonadaceae bacterium]